MITFSIPCWAVWFVSGHVAMLIELLIIALIVKARKKEETKPKSESDNHS